MLHQFKFVSSRNNLPKNVKDGACVVNLDESEEVSTCWIAFYVDDDKATYFDSFGVEHAPKKIKQFISSKSINTDI